MLAYLGYGLAGLGVFALGQSAWTPSSVPGVPVILGPTAGYLVGFPIAAFVTGWLAERGWDRHAWAVVLSALAGSLVVYACGVGWLIRYLGPAAPIAGLFPFLPGDLLKLLAAGGLLPTTWRLLHILGLVADQERNTPAPSDHR
jgi:biotin transport system substrate-specific component